MRTAKGAKQTTAKGANRKRTRGPRPPTRPLTVVCRCEDVTEEEIRQVIRQGYDSLEAVKRLLRTGMGHCQGRGCLRAIARMIEQETGRPVAEQNWPRSRPPLKPLPLGMLGGRAEYEPQRDERDSSQKPKAKTQKAKPEERKNWTATGRKGHTCLPAAKMTNDQIDI